MKIIDHDELIAMYPTETETETERCIRFRIKLDDGIIDEDAPIEAQCEAFDTWCEDVEKIEMYEDALSQYGYLPGMEYEFDHRDPSEVWIRFNQLVVS